MRQSVREASKALELKETKVQELTEKIISITALIHTLEGQRGFREKYLNALFGGNKDLVRELNQTREIKLDTEREIQNIGEEIAQNNAQIEKRIAEWPSKTDDNFNRIYKLEAQMKEVTACGETCLRKIDEAIDEIDDAETFEVMDFLTDSAAIADVSSLSNWNASGSLKEARKAVEEYRAKLAPLNHDLNSLEHTELFDGLDLAFDFLMADSFWPDFTSFFQLERLENAGEALSQFKVHLLQIKSKIDDDYLEIQREMEHFICQTRQICLSD